MTLLQCIDSIDMDKDTRSRGMPTYVIMRHPEYTVFLLHPSGRLVATWGGWRSRESRTALLFNSMP